MHDEKTLKTPAFCRLDTGEVRKPSAPWNNPTKMRRQLIKWAKKVMKQTGEDKAFVGLYDSDRLVESLILQADADAKICVATYKAKERRFILEGGQEIFGSSPFSAARKISKVFNVGAVFSVHEPETDMYYQYRVMARTTGNPDGYDSLVRLSGYPGVSQI